MLALAVYAIQKFCSVRQTEPYTPSSNMPLRTEAAPSAPDRHPCGTHGKPLNAAWFPT